MDHDASLLTVRLWRVSHLFLLFCKPVSIRLDSGVLLDSFTNWHYYFYSKTFNLNLWHCSPFFPLELVQWCTTQPEVEWCPPRALWGHDSQAVVVDKQDLERRRGEENRRKAEEREREGEGVKKILNTISAEKTTFRESSGRKLL